MGNTLPPWIVRPTGASEPALPDDLVAPLGGDDCCGTIWLATVGDVANAAAGIAPLIAPCCKRRFGILELGDVAFFSRVDWEAWDEDPDEPVPDVFYISHAFPFPAAKQ